MFRHAQEQSSPQAEVSVLASDQLLHELQVHKEKMRFARSAIKEMRERYVALYEFAAVGYITLSRAGVITEVNLTGAALFGIERSEVINSPFLNFVRAPNQAQWEQHFSQVLLRDGRQHCELDIERCDGSCFPARISSLKTDDTPSGRSTDEATCSEKHFSRAHNFRIVITDITEQRRADEERAGYLLRLEQTSRHLVAVQEESRRRLSRELHDRTSPNLAALSINLKIIANALPSDPTLAECLEDTRALIADTTDSIREICTEMRPPLLDYAGLAGALEGYASAFARRTGIAVRFDCALPDLRLAQNLESLLFRIFQEALTNSAKHAQASSIEVRLDHGGHPIVMTVTDNGTGFDPSRVAKNGQVGFGLLNMREMAEVARGRFTLESAPGKGTRISVEIA